MSVVIPVYRGAATLATVVDELLASSAQWQHVDITEIVLVHDHGPDDSARVIRDLEDSHPVVRSVWLTKNFGQHAATLAGMSASSGEWVVTIDEDGQHDPASIPDLIARAVDSHSPIVYGSPTNPPAHGRFRNWSSRTAKSFVASAAGVPALEYAQSFRLITGDVARSAASYAGPGAYLDVVLAWIGARSVTSPTRSRVDGRPSGYRFRTLLSHFWRLVLSAGTRPLRAIALIGVLFAVASLVLAVVFAVDRLSGADFPPGFAALIVATLLSAGVILVSLGVIAEYLGALIKVALGRPAFLIGSDPADGPLGRVVDPREKVRS